MRESATMLPFKYAFLKIGRPVYNIPVYNIPVYNIPVYNIHDPNRLKLLNRLRLGLSHRNEHKFDHNSKEYVNPLCYSSLEDESVSHYLLQCHYFKDIRKTFFNELQSADENI